MTEPLRLYETMSTIHADLTPDRQEQLTWLLDTLTAWWAGAEPDRHIRRRQAFVRWASDHGHPEYGVNRPRRPAPALPPGPAVTLADALAAARPGPCTNPSHEHTLPDGAPMTCPDCGQAARYDYATEMYVHDARIQGCHLTAGTPLGSPCRYEPTGRAAPK